MRYILLILILFFPAVSFAAELRLDRSTIVTRVGDTFVVDAVIQSGGESINAIEGSISFSSGISLVDIRLQNSIVPLWVSSPEKKEEGLISFAGILPGGYNGSGALFSLVFSASQKGTAYISFGKNTAVYQNDGQGTAVKLSLPALSFAIGASEGDPNIASLEKDVFPPEPFTPLVSSGEPFGMKGVVLVFTTQDKNSGVARYDISRSYRRNAKDSSLVWRSTQSPYEFVAGDSTRYLYVRAVDRTGNERVAMVPPQDFSPIAFFFDWWPLLVLGGVGIVILDARKHMFLR